MWNVYLHVSALYKLPYQALSYSRDVHPILGTDLNIVRLVELEGGGGCYLKFENIIFVLITITKARPVLKSVRVLNADRREAFLQFYSELTSASSLTMSCVTHLRCSRSSLLPTMNIGADSCPAS